MALATMSGLLRSNKLLKQRGSVRYHLLLPVILRWKDADGVRHISEGITRDISLKGVFVYCNPPPEVGTALRLEIIFPPLEPAARGRLRLRAEARVIALREMENGIGFAATSDFGTRLELQALR